MNVATLRDALLFAMDKERKANEHYLLFRDRVKDAAARALLQELADQEMGHWRMIREALDSGSVEGIGAKAKGRDIQISDYMVEIELTPDSSPQDIMVAAMQMEKKATDFYGGLVDQYRGTDLEALFSRLAREEMRHKEILEKEYEEHFAQWM
ncbi:MAG: Rubrerythrin [Syntrophaceae bacterium PtaU1.Bin231]|nr:MAG: Rubrerythrin [Syntrophaceae bacterium PtaU1.Bin231]